MDLERQQRGEEGEPVTEFTVYDGVFAGDLQAEAMRAKVTPTKLIEEYLYLGGLAFAREESETPLRYFENGSSRPYVFTNNEFSGNYPKRSNKIGESWNFTLDKQSAALLKDMALHYKISEEDLVHKIIASGLNYYQKFRQGAVIMCEQNGDLVAIFPLNSE